MAVNAEAQHVVLLHSWARQPGRTTYNIEMMSIFESWAQVIESESCDDALRLLSSLSNISAVLVTDPGILSPAQQSLVTIISIYVRAGGTLLLCSWVSSCAHHKHSRDLFKKFMSRNFGSLGPLHNLWNSQTSSSILHTYPTREHPSRRRGQQTCPISIKLQVSP